MKRIISLVVAISSLVIMSAQDISMRNILKVAAPIVEYVEVENNQEIVHMEFDIAQASPKYAFRMLHTGYTYGICAFGDYRVADLDIRVYKDVDGEMVLIKKDEDASDVATVVIEPTASGNYIIEISAYKFVDGYDVGHYGLIIFHE